VAHTSVLRVGLLTLSFKFLCVDRIDLDGTIQTPTCKTDAWGTQTREEILATRQDTFRANRHFSPLTLPDCRTIVDTLRRIAPSW
jgi:hypothetical protein